ncbi:TPA_asm: RNA-directed RNA polymerase [ssRNA phage Gerhypos.4_8]|uniref:RNA-directed RNA polymerase n=2 Tax=Leviviricetes TaxID=2842243 RepID=A0A8S5KXE8_9VIRU|nr:RNA-directed RNA polymerase [ssRNA phage Gerhypos.4_8]QDH88027.1 MAG: RNA-dependent RNA polymerase [Leviviridae sp.]DAD49953.1 TPA_asm: RNA-directed RNA polymerase [ssRNA phage Gerhypos.4_8]
MKSLITLLQCVLDDSSTRSGVSTARDFKTITSRIEHEGISFLTISLARFGKDFTKSLDDGRVAHASFAGFQRRGALPLLLGGLLARVFDPESGLLLDPPSLEAIRCVRQVTLMWAKILPDSSPGLERIQCTPARERAAIDRWVECEQDVRESFEKLLLSEERLLEDFRSIGNLLWREFFTSIDNRLYDEMLFPKHGPGATADKLRGNAKYKLSRWSRRLEEAFPHWEYLIPNPTSPEQIKTLRSVQVLEPRDEQPVRVVTVPKTLDTPRIIAVEPSYMQYMQQAVLAMMVQEIPGFYQTREFMQFVSQEPNQRLAREGSITGDLATLDLSEASDRVSNQHVRLLVEKHRWLSQALDATRSRKADVPGHGVKRLAKFASMGSALCFPMESLVFVTVIFVGIQQQLNRRLTERDLKSFIGRVRVYGDDIIIPKDYAQSVIRALETFGFRVNERKSFWNGQFRESCGEDYYAGQSTKVVRLRTLLPEDRRHVREIAAAVSFRNQLYHAGWEKTVAWLDARIERLIPFPYVRSETRIDRWVGDFVLDPTIVSASPLLGRHGSPKEVFLQDGLRHDDKLQRPVVKGVRLVPQIPVSKLESYGALMKWFLVAESPFLERPRRDPWWETERSPLDEDHLERAGRASSVRIKTGWDSPL